MTGGSLNKTSGKILGRKNEIENLKMEINSLEKEIIILEEEKNNIQKSREEKQLEYEEYTNKKNTLVSEYEIFFQKDSIYKNEIESKEKLLESIKSQIENYKKEKENNENEKNKIIEKINNISKEIEIIEEKLNQGIQSNPEDIKRMDDLNFDITNLKVSISSFEESKNSVFEILNILIEQIKEQTKINEDRTKNLEEGLGSKEKLEEENRNIYKQIEEIQSSNTNYSKETEILRKEREEKNILIKNLEEEQKVRNDRLIDIKEKISKYEFDLEKVEIKKDSLVLYMWDEYELTPNSEILKKYEDKIINKENRNDKKEKDYKGNKNNLDIDNQDIKEIHNLEEEQKKSNKKIKELKQEIKELGSVNIDAIEEYRKTKERYDFLIEQRKDLEKTINSLRQVISEIQKVMKEQFELSFKQININFSKIFKELFGGGKAQVILENNKDLLESGIEIQVEPPGKRLQSMSLLSGGERALTAIALLFAILSINPSPFCVLDEIESALDEANVTRYARFLKNYSKNTQFLIITHRKGTMEIADNIYGVTMQESGISNIVSMSLKAAQKTGKN